MHRARTDFFRALHSHPLFVKAKQRARDFHNALEQSERVLKEWVNLYGARMLWERCPGELRTITVCEAGYEYSPNTTKRTLPSSSKTGTGTKISRNIQSAKALENKMFESLCYFYKDDKDMIAYYRDHPLRQLTTRLLGEFVFKDDAKDSAEKRYAFRAGCVRGLLEVIKDGWPDVFKEYAEDKEMPLDPETRVASRDIPIKAEEEESLVEDDTIVKTEEVAPVVEEGNTIESEASMDDTPL